MTLRELCVSLLAGGALTVAGQQGYKVAKPKPKRPAVVKTVNRTPLPAVAQARPAPYCPPTVHVMTTCPQGSLGIDALTPMELPPLSEKPSFFDRPGTSVVIVDGGGGSGGGGGGTIIPGVPAPDVWAMLVVGFGCVGLAARRRKVVNVS